MKNSKAKGRITRSLRIRKKISNIKDRPRLTVFRSNKSIYGQIIDDNSGKTLVSVSEKELGEEKSKKLPKNEKAKLAGLILAKKAVKAKISKVVFDRSGYKFHGRVKAFADSAREGGLIF